VLGIEEPRSPIQKKAELEMENPKWSDGLRFQYNPSRKCLRELGEEGGVKRRSGSRRKVNERARKGGETESFQLNVNNAPTGKRKKGGSRLKPEKRGRTKRGGDRGGMSGTNVPFGGKDLQFGVSPEKRSKDFADVKKKPLQLCPKEEEGKQQTPSSSWGWERNDGGKT